MGVRRGDGDVHGWRGKGVRNEVAAEWGARYGSKEGYEEELKCLNELLSNIISFQITI